MHFSVNLESNSVPQFIKTKYSETTVMSTDSKTSTRYLSFADQRAVTVKHYFIQNPCRHQPILSWHPHQTHLGSQTQAAEAVCTCWWPASKQGHKPTAPNETGQTSHCQHLAQPSLWSTDIPVHLGSIIQQIFQAIAPKPQRVCPHGHTNLF